MKVTHIILILTLNTYLAYSQEDMLIEEATSQMIENDNEEGTLALRESLHELLLNPVNLNTSSEQQLLGCGLFSPYQVYGILEHREEYGPIFSLHELINIPGISIDFLQNIARLVSLSANSIKVEQGRNKGMILTNIYKKIPASIGYLFADSTTPAYPGSPYKISNRFRYNIGNKITIGTAYEKDAGENAFNNWKPEHLTGYVKYAPGTFIRNITVGNFRLHTGLGLVHGLGFSSSGSGIQINGYRTAYSKPFASTAEYDYYRGILTEIGTKNWSCITYYSFKPEDISLFSLDNSDKSFDLFKARRTTGIHRTMTEIKGRDLIKQHTAGLSLNRNHLHINYGVSACASFLKAGTTLLDSVPFIADAKNSAWNLSAYAMAYGKRHEVYGEIAINEGIHPALIIAGKTRLNPALNFYLSFRHYHPQYSGQIPGAYQAGSGVANETGLNSGMLIIPFNKAKIKIDTDISYSPSESYYLSVPGFSHRSKIEFSYSFPGGPEIIARYSNKSRQIDKARLSPGLEITGKQNRDQWRMHYTYSVSENFKLGGRVEWVFSDRNNYGSLLYQQIQFSHKEWLSLTYRILHFDIDSWGNRIYCYEPGVRYSFLFPSYYGKGLKNSMVISARLARWTTIRFRLGYIHYANKWENGSGKDIRNGDQTLEAELQLQLSF